MKKILFSRNYFFLPLWGILLFIGSGAVVVVGVILAFFFTKKKKTNDDTPGQMTQKKNNEPELVSTKTQNQTVQKNNQIQQSASTNVSNLSNKQQTERHIVGAEKNSGNNSEGFLAIRLDLRGVIAMKDKGEWAVCWEKANAFYNAPTNDGLENLTAPSLALWLNACHNDDKKMNMLAKICNANGMNPKLFPKITVLIIHEYHRIMNTQSDNADVRKEVENFLIDPKTISPHTISDNIKAEFEKVKKSILEHEKQKLAKVGLNNVLKSTDQNINTKQPVDNGDNEIFDVNLHWKNGNLMYSGQAIKDPKTGKSIRHGKGVTYCKDGNTIMEEGKYQNGFLEEGIKYWDNGKKMWEGIFDEKGVLKEGKMYDHKDGLLLCEGVFENNDIKNGKIYNQNGDIEEVVQNFQHTPINAQKKIDNNVSTNLPMLNNSIKANI